MLLHMQNASGTRHSCSLRDDDQVFAAARVATICTASAISDPRQQPNALE
jgi:hypothetical protein